VKTVSLIIWLLSPSVAWAGTCKGAVHTGAVHTGAVHTTPEVILKKANTLADENKVDSAAFYFEQAYQLLAEQQAWAKAIEAKKGQADLFFRNRSNEQAVEAFRYMLDSVGRQLTDTLRGEAYYKIGLSYARMARFVPALDHMKQATHVRSLVYDTAHLTLATTYHMLGRLFFVIGDYRQSLHYQQQFTQILQANYDKGHARLAEAYLYVGLSYSRLYEHELALEFYQKTLDILLSKDPANNEGVASTYNNIGLVYGRMGQINQELKFLHKALSLRTSDNSAKATNMHNIGRAHVDLQQYDEGLDYLQRAVRLKIRLVGPQHTTVATTFGQIGHLYRELQQLDSALHYQRKALAIDKLNYGAFGIDLSDDYAELAKTFTRQAQTDTALCYLQRAIGSIVQGYDADQLEQQPQPDQLILDKRTLSRLLKEKSKLLFSAYAETGDTSRLQLAYRCSKAAVDFSERVFTELHDQQSVTFLAESANTIYEQNLKTAMELYEQKPEVSLLEQAFLVMERNKARLLLQNIARSRWKNTTAVSDSLLNAETALRSQLAYVEKLRFEEAARSETDSVKLADIQNQLFALRQQLEETEKKILAQNPQKNTVLYQPRYAQLSEIQKLLDSDELILEYFEGEEKLYGMTIGPEDAELFELADRQQFHARIEQFSQGLRDREYARYAESAHEIFRQVVNKFSALKDSHVTRLIVIPDGQLGYIPFEALLSTAPPQEAAYQRLSYLIKDYTLAYQYSASLLLQTAQENLPPFDEPFLGYAPTFDRQRNPLLATRSAADRQLVSDLQDLPYAREEVEGIAELLAGKAFTADAATESHFKQSAARGKILHLASHTLINDQEPLYSRLVFSPNEQSEEDGLLHTYELYGMDIPAEMVTLSACNTGLGKIKAGEGIISLARGFMYAGVSNVLMSLWAVSDRSTAQLMRYFYESLKRGTDRAHALRKAKLRYLEQADANTAAPYYWSAFILVSSDQEEDNLPYTWWYFILIPGTAILATSWWLIKNKFS